MCLTRIKAAIVAIVSMTVAVTTATWMVAGSSFAAAGDRRVIKITVSPDLKTNWSAEARLYDKPGNQVYYWHEAHGAGEGYVRWEYRDGGDGGRVDLKISPSGGQTVGYLSLALDANHCYEIVPVGNAAAVNEVWCAFG